MLSGAMSSSKPEVPQKPRHIPPPVPLRVNKLPSSQQQQLLTQSPVPPQPAQDSEYPMNATWLFHSPPPPNGGPEQKQRSDWIKEQRTRQAAADLPPKLCLKSVPVLPVKPQNKSPLPQPAKSSAEEASCPENKLITPPRRDLNFANEIKSRCSQRLTERLPPQVHYSTNVSIVFMVLYNSGEKMNRWWC